MGVGLSKRQAKVRVVLLKRRLDAASAFKDTTSDGPKFKRIAGHDLKAIEPRSFAQKTSPTMSIDRRKAVLFGTAAAIRLLLFTGFPGLPDLMTARVEISTPVTSFKRCRRRISLLQNLDSDL